MLLLSMERCHVSELAFFGEDEIFPGFSGKIGTSVSKEKLKVGVPRFCDNF